MLENNVMIYSHSNRKYYYEITWKNAGVVIRKIVSKVVLYLQEQEVLKASMQRKETLQLIFKIEKI